MALPVHQNEYLDLLRSYERHADENLLTRCEELGRAWAEAGLDTAAVLEMHREACATLDEELPASDGRLRMHELLPFSHVLLGYADGACPRIDDAGASGPDAPPAGGPAPLEAEQRLRLALQATGMATWVWDLSTRDFHTDQRFRDMVRREELHTWEDFLSLIYPADVERLVGGVFRLLVDGEHLDAEFRVHDADGDFRHLHVQAVPNRTREGRARVFGVCLDVSERKRMLHRLEQQIHMDPLTGILNRRGLSRSLEREAERRRRSGNSMQALFIDLDDFKRVNDVYGHSTGDLVLRTVAELLRETVRATDHVARIGGDEFLVILPNTRRAEARPVADKIHRALTEAQVSDKFPHLRLSVSVGMVSAGSRDEMVQDLLVRTERALHSAKRQGKGQVFHERRLFGHDEQRPMSFTEIVGELKDPTGYTALRQPIVAVKDGALRGYEMLTRSRCPALASPEDFLHFAMDAGMAREVDMHAFRACCEASRDVPPELLCHLNVLPSTVIGEDGGFLLEQLPASRPSGNYCLEISEKEAIGDPRSLAGFVERARAAGVRVALDDVGYGKSSLEALILLEPEIIKIDRQLVHGVARDGGQRRALERLLGIASVWEAAVIAEGVETEEDLAVLRALEVPYVQGFLTGRPS